MNIKTVSKASDAPDMNMEYYAGRDIVSARIFVFHIKPDHNGVALIDLTPENMATITCSTQISGLYDDGSFFAGVVNRPLTKPHVSVQIGSFYFQGAFGNSADAAVNALSKVL